MGVGEGGAGVGVTPTEDGRQEEAEVEVEHVEEDGSVAEAHSVGQIGTLKNREKVHTST